VNNKDPIQKESQKQSRSPLNILKFLIANLWRAKLSWLNYSDKSVQTTIFTGNWIGDIEPVFKLTLRSTW
ncbi:MAG: hypothetical protein MJK04_37255, partial [Psychrosphaera sp.]|nr:hypothetical protein [Psychrosphaera sp.]